MERKEDNASKWHSTSRQFDQLVKVFTCQFREKDEKLLVGSKEWGETAFGAAASTMFQFGMATVGRTTVESRGKGWTLFAGVILIWGGVMKVFDAIWAFRYHGTLPSNLEAAIFGHNLKTYGWVDLAVAAILVICGFLLMSGSEIARWIGIGAAGIAGISAIWWMPFYPVWGFVYIFVAALVIYALAVYGGDREVLQN